MFKKIFNKKKEEKTENNILVAALLVHGARIDENYTEAEKKIITKAIMDLNKFDLNKAGIKIVLFLFISFFFLKKFFNIYLNLNSDSFLKGLSLLFFVSLFLLLFLRYVGLYTKRSSFLSLFFLVLYCIKSKSL